MMIYIFVSNVRPARMHVVYILHIITSYDHMHHFFGYRCDCRFGGLIAFLDICIPKTNGRTTC